MDILCFSFHYDVTKFYHIIMGLDWILFKMNYYKEQAFSILKLYYRKQSPVIVMRFMQKGNHRKKQLRNRFFEMWEDLKINGIYTAAAVRILRTDMMLSLIKKGRNFKNINRLQLILCLWDSCKKVIIKINNLGNIFYEMWEDLKIKRNLYSSCCEEFKVFNWCCNWFKKRRNFKKSIECKVILFLFLYKTFGCLCVKWIVFKFIKIYSYCFVK